VLSLSDDTVAVKHIMSLMPTSKMHSIEFSNRHSNCVPYVHWRSQDFVLGAHNRGAEGAEIETPEKGMGRGCPHPLPSRLHKIFTFIFVPFAQLKRLCNFSTPLGA